MMPKSTVLSILAMTASSAGAVALQRCTTSANCSTGQTCQGVPISSQSNRYCVQTTHAPYYTPCDAPGEKACCNNTDCTNKTVIGVCDKVAGENLCGAKTTANVCLFNECEDKDGLQCAGWEEGQKCVLAGFAGYRHNVCRVGGCTGDVECTSAKGGECTAFFGPDAKARACGPALQGFFCTYPGGVCRKDSDCKDGGICVFDMTTGAAKCLPKSTPHFLDAVVV